MCVCVCVFAMVLLDTCKITKRYLTIPFEPTIPLSRKQYIMIETQSTSVSGAGRVGGRSSGMGRWASGDGDGGMASRNSSTDGGGRSGSSRSSSSSRKKKLVVDTK